jgi:hypothetical protein
MDANGILVDLQGMQDFRDHLTLHLQQIAAQLSTLAHTDGPELGSFYHAQQTEQQYDALQRGYLSRLRRLILALAVSDASVGSVLDAYSTRGQDSAAWLKVATDLLDNDTAARAAVGADPVLAAILGQDPQLSQALNVSPGDAAGNGAAGNGVVGGGNTNG